MPDGQTPANEPPKVQLVTRPLTILESLRAARNNLLEIIPNICTKQPIVSGKTGIVRWHMVMDPGALRRILKDKLEIYPKSDITKNLLRPAIGDSLFIAEGAHWRWQRRAVAPVFSHRNIAGLAPIMSAAAEAASERLEACEGKADLYAEMVQATFEVISNVTFSGSGAMDSDAVHRAINAYIDQAARVSLFDVLGVPTWVPRWSRMFGANSVAEMKTVADQAIERRRQNGPKAVPDLLDLLLDGIDPETRKQMNNAELRDNLLTFIVAGHETTALTLAWALYLCAFDPVVQERVREEAQSVLQGRTAGPEDIGRLPYTEQVINEALRLYPPAGFLSRTAQAPDTLCGREVRRRDTVMMPIYALHRNELLWEEPDAFRPERFADGAEYNRFAYLPFGDGPRVCIGAHFATVEAQIILATLVSRFRFTRIEGRDPKPVMVLTLRPEGGVWLEVEPVSSP
ncbi:MAG: cytochrome P450 [Rhodobacteraceae bacterium]|nr:cytochrome P450 [Paracoccaceae bacterium]